jgi:transposase InsO family protein
MSERMKLVSDYLSGDYGISELAIQYEVSRKTIYKWIGRHESGGWEALKDQSRAPKNHPNAVSREIEAKVLELKARKPLWGAPKLRVKLIELLGQKQSPAESTVSAILKRHGLSRIAKRRRQAVPTGEPFGDCIEANRVWCADFKGWFLTGDGQKCTPLTISDGHSRYLLCCQGLRDDTGMLTVKPLFIETFRKHGLPEAIRTDNGTPFASSGLGGLTALAVWWVRLGIKLERIEPGQPQQNGRHERMHRTLKEATASPPKENLAAQQEAFNEFCKEYNQERPHEALGQRPPVVFYENSTRAYPERLPAQGGYPEDWERRRVRKAGQMKWKGKDIRLSKALWGQEVGLRPVDDGRWEIYFEDLVLGMFDERKGHVVPSKRLVIKQTNDLP